MSDVPTATLSLDENCECRGCRSNGYVCHRARIVGAVPTVTSVVGRELWALFQRLHMSYLWDENCERCSNGYFCHRARIVSAVRTATLGSRWTGVSAASASVTARAVSVITGKYLFKNQDLVFWFLPILLAFSCLHPLRLDFCLWLILFFRPDPDLKKCTVGKNVFPWPRQRNSRFRHPERTYSFLQHDFPILLRPVWLFWTGILWPSWVCTGYPDLQDYNTGKNTFTDLQ